jgi:hypothetical protein
MKRLAFILSLALCSVAHRAHAQCRLPRAEPAVDSAGRSRHAEDAEWYRDRRPIRFANRLHVQYGLPRTVPADSMVYIGEHEGVPVYTEVNAREIEVIYLLFDARCQVAAYEANRAFDVVSPDGASLPPGSDPAVLFVTGCPRGGELYLFPAEAIAADPRWRDKLVPQSDRFLGVTTDYSLIVLTAVPRAYDVVLRYHGHAWRFRADAVPRQTRRVDARPPGRARCEVPVYPVL